MARKLHWFALAALSFGLTGCVTSTDKYTAVKLENESLRASLTDAEAQKREAQARAEAYQKQLSMLSEGDQSKVGLITNLQKQLEAEQALRTDLQRRYEDALNRVGASPLPAAVTSALDTFAKANPELVDFDAARGMVKFKTDFTFATGSAEPTPKAVEVIGRFAQILNSDAAKTYELMVAGHTDDTPVNNPATKAKHPNNWYLSSHRAISVGDQLQKNAVSPQRIAVVGYGDQRPVASNASAAGKAQNRRVEVMILPTTVKSTVVTGAKPSGNGTAAKKPALNKDVVAPVDRSPALNK